MGKMRRRKEKGTMASAASFEASEAGDGKASGGGSRNRRARAGARCTVRVARTRSDSSRMYRTKEERRRKRRRPGGKGEEGNRQTAKAVLMKKRWVLLETGEDWLRTSATCSAARERSVFRSDMKGITERRKSGDWLRVCQKAVRSHGVTRPKNMACERSTLRPFPTGLFNGTTTGSPGPFFLPRVSRVGAAFLLDPLYAILRVLSLHFHHPTSPL